jgi:multidrug resistance protein, MATE family
VKDGAADSNSDSSSDTTPAAPSSRLLTGDLRRTVFFLALPVLFEQFLTFLVGFYDTFLSGRISADATAAVGLAAYVGWLAGMLLGLVGAGTTALVARHWGAGEFEDANRTMNRSIAMAIVLGTIVYAFVLTAAPVFADLLGMEGETRRIVVRYLRVDGLGYLFTSVTLIGAAALRGSGDMRSPMWILGLVNVINVLASTVLVYGLGPFPALGVDGIVAGTVVARLGGGLIMLSVLSSGLTGLQLLRREMRVKGNTVRRILKIGLPAAVDGAVNWAGHLLFLMVISRLQPGGDAHAVFAAHIIGIRVEAITYLPATAWGYAAATMVGQALGAHNRKRAAQVGHEAALQCSLLAVLITLIFFTGASAIYELMHTEQAVRDIGIPAFRLLAFFQVPLVISIVYRFALRGAGDTRFPMYVSAFGAFGVRLPLAYLGGIVFDGGLIGAWVGMFADMAITALLVAARYTRGRWAELKV